MVSGAALRSKASESDADIISTMHTTVLNSGGVRFGSSEIYTVVEDIEEVEDCLVVAQKTPDADERVVLFVKPLKGSLDNSLRSKIRESIKLRLSSRHVPAVMIQLERIPYTTNGKRLEVSFCLEGILHRSARLHL